MWHFVKVNEGEYVINRLMEQIAFMPMKGYEMRR